MSLIETDSFQSSGLTCAIALNNMTLDELERSTGIKADRIDDIECGRVSPSQKEIGQLASALKVQPDFFKQAWVELPESAIHFRAGKSSQ